MKRLTRVVVTTLCVAPVLGLQGLNAVPGLAHSEGLTPYRYVTAPPGVISEGPAQAGLSTQPLGAPGFAGTTDNQMQLTLPAGALPARAGERGVRVTLDQLDPAVLPALPSGLEPEGNAYRVRMTYVASGLPVTRLARPAVLGLSAPAAPTGLYELVGRDWRAHPYTPVAAEEGFSSVVSLGRPGTFLQAYDPPAPGAAPQRAQVPPAGVPVATTTALPNAAGAPEPVETQGQSVGPAHSRTALVLLGVAALGLLLVAAFATRRQLWPRGRSRS